MLISKPLRSVGWLYSRDLDLATNGLSSPLKESEKVAETAPPPRDTGPWEAGSEERALPLWAGRHRLAGTVPSERGVPAAWVCLQRELEPRGDRVYAAPWKVLLVEARRAAPSWLAGMPRPASLTFGMFLCFMTATFGSRVTL